MSTGLTFGTISALYGLTNNIITKEQYTFLVGTVIASAIIPTLIANKFFLPRHLLTEPILDDQAPEIPSNGKVQNQPSILPKTMKYDNIKLNDNHKRSLSSTLMVVEQLQVDLMDVMVNSNQTCCYELKKDIDIAIIEHNQKVIKEALSIICSLKEKYNTDKSVQSLQRIVDAKKTKIWETLHNSKSRRMKGFGEFPQKLIKEYDTDIDQLIAVAEKIKLKNK